MDEEFFLLGNFATHLFLLVIAVLLALQYYFACYNNGNNIPQGFLLSACLVLLCVCFLFCQVLHAAVTVDDSESPWLSSLAHLVSPVKITLDKLETLPGKGNRGTLGRPLKRTEGNSNKHFINSWARCCPRKLAGWKSFYMCMLEAIVLETNSFRNDTTIAHYHTTTGGVLCGGP